MPLAVPRCDSAAAAAAAEDCLVEVGSPSKGGRGSSNHLVVQIHAINSIQHLLEFIKGDIIQCVRSPSGHAGHKGERSNNNSSSTHYSGLFTEPDGLQSERLLISHIHSFWPFVSVQMIT
jgi:hypothetical protein